MEEKAYLPSLLKYTDLSYMSNPGDYDEDDYDTDYEIIEIDD